MDAIDLESTTLPQRLALLALVDLADRGETPATVVAVRDCCGDHLDEVATDVVGTPTEVDVTRALNELAVTNLLVEHTGDTTPTGKGRPSYELAVDPAALLEALEADERLAEAVARVRDVAD